METAAPVSGRRWNNGLMGQLLKDVADFLSCPQRWSHHRSSPLADAIQRSDIYIDQNNARERGTMQIRLFRASAAPQPFVFF
jgi:hypothetical protein